MDKPSKVYVTFIASSPDKAWELLTNAAASPEWFFGHRMEVGDGTGDPFILLRPDGSLHVDGTILVKEPWHRLRVSWVMPDMPIRPADDEIEFLIEDRAEGVVRFAVHEYHGAPLPERWVVAAREGWSLFLSGVKTMLETGKPLPHVEMTPPE
jgi:uncharacterized protein YndB with AHSA1/START domain